MDKNEKLFLLQKIMEDIRGDWGSDLLYRIEEAEYLAEKLELQKTLSLLSEYKEDIAEGDTDGRILRCHYEDGGYIGLKDLHGLTNTIIDKSQDFKWQIDKLNNPECHFDDWTLWIAEEKEKYSMY